MPNDSEAKVLLKELFDHTIQWYEGEICHEEPKEWCTMCKVREFLQKDQENDQGLH